MEIQLNMVQVVYEQLVPARIHTVSHCENPHPLYITEEHCPPKRAPEIPRRE